jgi:hypothetical protein
MFPRESSEGSFGIDQLVLLRHRVPSLSCMACLTYDESRTREICRPWSCSWELLSCICNFLLELRIQMFIGHGQFCALLIVVVVLQVCCCWMLVDLTMQVIKQYQWCVWEQMLLCCLLDLSSKLPLDQYVLCSLEFQLLPSFQSYVHSLLPLVYWLCNPTFHRIAATGTKQSIHTLCSTIFVVHNLAMYKVFGAPPIFGWHNCT